MGFYIRCKTSPIRIKNATETNVVRNKSQNITEKLLKYYNLINIVINVEKDSFLIYSEKRSIILIIWEVIRC